MIKARVKKPIPWKKIIAPTLAAVAAVGISVPVTIAIMKKNQSSPVAVQHTITYVDDYGSGTVTNQKVTDGTLAKMYVPEHRSNVGFKGWKLVKQDLTTKTEEAPYFDFMNTPIHKDITIYSHYRKDTTTGEYEVDTDEAFVVEDSTEGDGYIIKGINKEYFKDKIFDVVIPDTITFNGQTKPVVGIGSTALMDFDWETFDENIYKFNSISLPNSIKTFTEQAFANCRHLRILNMPTELTTIGYLSFWNCTKLADIKFYDKLEKVEYGAFNGADAGSPGSYIRTLELPSSLKFIGGHAFENNAIQTLDLSKCNNLVLDNEAFYGAINLREITLPEGLPYIPYNCFKLCTRLRKIEIPSTVKYIETYAFNSCYRLREVYFRPQSELIFIEGETFSDCPSLEKTNLPAKLKYLGDGVFPWCTNLSYVTFDNEADWYYTHDGETKSWNPHTSEPLENAKRLQECCDAYETCSVKPYTDTETGLKFLTGDNSQCFVVGCENSIEGTLTIPNTVTIDGVDYQVNGISAKAFKGQTGITSIEFQTDSPLQYIYEHAFAGCQNITSINFGNCKDLTYIGDYAFYNAFVNGTASAEIDCSTLSNLKHIGNYAFFVEKSEYNDNDGTIKTVKLPNSLIYLGNGAFYNQKNITTFDFFNDDKESTLKNIGNDQDSVLLYPIVNATNLTSIDMSKCTQLTYLPRSAFQGATSLTKITLPNNLIYIEEYACEECTNLTSIEIPSTCSYIGCGAFDKAGLKSTTFNDIQYKEWLVYKGSTYETCDVSTPLPGETTVDASNAKRLAALFAQYSWLKID